MSSDSRDEILDAVAAVIVRDGVRGASMRTVAQEADVSLGLLSYHFSDKDSLITAAYARAADQLLEASVDAAKGVDDPADRLSAYIRGAFEKEFLDEGYLNLRLSLWAVARTEPDVAAVERDLYMQYAETMVELIAAADPSLSTDVVNDRATDVILTQNGLWLNWGRFADAHQLERGLERCERIALTGAG